jgi:ubiquinone/menaquinone biosynthesis C-methylase UbiE
MMDTCHAADAEPTLKDLVRLNRYFGGHRAILQTLRRAGCDGKGFSLLDVGAASGDTSQIVRRTFARASVLNMDQNEINLSQAPEPKIVANAFDLPFEPKSFDYVFCSSFLHHFTDDQIIDLLRKFAAVARRAVVAVDIERHRVPCWFMKHSPTIMRWHWLTVHDGLISVRASLRTEELRGLAVRAGLRDVETRVHRPAFRISLIGHPGD